MKLIVILIILSVLAVNAKKVHKLTKNDVPTARIIGGEEAPENIAPYQISLQYYESWYDGYEHNCGGSIVSDRWIITAAHCVYGWSPQNLYVATGSNKWDKPIRRYFPESIHIHPHYDTPDYHNDIALIRVNETIEFNESTQPIALGDEPLKEGDELLLTGWGSTELYGETPENLQMLKVKFVPYDKCLTDLGPSLSLDLDKAGNICTFIGLGFAACHGDSGGPFVHNNKLYGVVNWGLPCALGYPDVQASIVYYQDFLRKTMQGCNWPVC